MASDLAVPFTLTTPGGTIVFNDDSDAQFYITDIGGLAMPDIRAPVDRVPLGDGGLIHDFWRDARRIPVEGVFLIYPGTRTQDQIVQQRNSMEDDLVNALESILRADGTFAYTPQGLGTRTWTVNCEIKLECRPADNYLLRSFTFGLIAGDPDWSGSS